MSDSVNITNKDRKFAGLVSILQGLLIFIPTFVLGAAIDWPASLDDPASIALPRLLTEETSVRIGYIAYLIYSILFLVSMFLLVKVSKGKVMGGLWGLIIGFAAVSTVSRSIGIIRWLVVMPVLAEQWNQATTDQERESISVTFDAINSFGGTIGEVLGVSIFAAISVMLFSRAVSRDHSMPKSLVVLGVVSGLGLLATATELFGVEPDALVTILGTTLVQLWFLFVGIWLLTSNREKKLIS